MRSTRQFMVGRPEERTLTWGDVFVFFAVVLFLYVGIRLAFDTPDIVQGPDISLSREALPWYAVLSIGRMTAAYLLSLLFALVYGRLATRSRAAERILMPMLDVFQSIPILSFLPVVLLGLTAILPQQVAVELASIVLIFTSQVWNLIFAWYQSLITIPKELREASATYRFNGWLRFKTLELPFAANNLIWNSIMSWAGGWFFLMAAEIFTVGERDFRLPGLGTYLQEAANRGDVQAIVWGIATLVIVIIAFDQLVWRPILAWADRFRIEMVENDNPPTSWFYDLIAGSRVYNLVSNRVWSPLNEALDRLFSRGAPEQDSPAADQPGRRWLTVLLALIVVIVIGYGLVQVVQALLTVSGDKWLDIGIGLVATFLHVAAALLIAIAWTLPVGVLIGTKPQWARVLQPIIQILASIPATAFFPVLVFVLVRLTGSLTLPAILLMLMGTQWYLLFNIIAGSNAIPQDMKYTTTLLHLKGRERWRTLILPALFPYLITGAITASGGAWNASIVAEYIQFNGQTLTTSGIGAVIAQSTAQGDYALLLASTLSMITTVVLINRFVWRRLYRLAADKYRME